VKFALAVANWRIAQRPPAPTGWKSTCGSAERMYASDPERGGAQEEADESFYSHHEAWLFEGLVRTLPADWRLAWHIKNGFRTAGDKDEEWINEHYNLARAQLSVWWSRSLR
jgi:hypothetical protein